MGGRGREGISKTLADKTASVFGITPTDGLTDGGDLLSMRSDKEGVVPDTEGFGQIAANDIKQKNPEIGRFRGFCIFFEVKSWNLALGVFNFHYCNFWLRGVT